MKNIIKTLIVAGAALSAFSCQEEEGRVEVPYTRVTGEFVSDMHLTQPFEAEDHQNILIYNTAEGTDSLWVEDANFFESKVKVKWNGDNTFSAVEGEDVFHGEVVNITGEVFPEKDSVSIEWRYLQGGDPEEDYVVTARGVLYNGLDN